MAYNSQWTRAHMDKKLQRAGGYRITQGSPKARNFRTYQRRPWILATRRHIRKRLKAGCGQTRAMCDQATQDFGIVGYPPYLWDTVRQSPGKHGTPLDRARDIIHWIIQQGKFSAVDILTVALATDIMVKHWDGMPLQSYTEAWRRPYFRSVQIGKAIHKMLRANVRTYEHDNGHGSVRTEVVRYKKGLTSRYVCQRLQGLCEAIYSDYKASYSREIASLVDRRAFLNAKANRTGITCWSSSLN